MLFIDVPINEKNITLYTTTRRKLLEKKKIIKNANTYWLSIVKYETMAHINVESRGRIHPTNK